MRYPETTGLGEKTAPVAVLGATAAATFPRATLLHRDDTAHGAGFDSRFDLMPDNLGAEAGTFDRGMAAATEQRAVV